MFSESIIQRTRLVTRNYLLVTTYLKLIMKLFPKFIIEEENLILKMVTNHRDIATNKSKVTGGGNYIFDIETNSFMLYGESYEFGASKIEDIKKCIDEGKVYLNDALTISIAGKNNFSFYNGTEIIKLFVCASNH
ncbi:MAG: hypothetical protein WCG93_11775 [Paludibacter sp.]